MSTLFDDLPDVMQNVWTRPLFVMRLNVRKLQLIGAAPGVHRRVGVVPSGVFEGERLSGELLDGGNHWQNVRSDGSTTLDVRLVLKTRDEVLVGMNYKGIRQGPPRPQLGWKMVKSSIQPATIFGSYRSSRLKPRNTPG